MCAIIGWSGRMPVGLLFQLFHAAEHRGRDSTGVAYWDEEKGQNFLVKHAVTASLFTKINPQYVSTAQRSIRGIAHTRRASPRMPVDNDNAHPFMYDSCVFAHNGVVRNWKELQQSAIPNLEKLAATDEKMKGKLEYMKGITTDSMTLGPAIESLDFSPIVGAIGLVWLDGEKLHAFRSKKELTSANIAWTSDKEDDTKEHQLTIVASTWDIIEIALGKVRHWKYDAVEHILNEATAYEITPGKVIDCGPVPVNSANATDKFTSSVEGRIQDQLPLDGIHHLGR